MISVFIYTVFAIGIIATAAYTGFVVWRTFDVTAQSQRNAARMAEIGVVLRANLWVDPQGVPRAPYGDATPGDRQRLPSWVVGDDHTAWGARYGWCPMSISDGAATSIASVASGASPYQVGLATVRQPAIPGEPYVVSASPNPTLGGSAPRDAVGVVVSPVPYSFQLPDCATVAWRNGFTTVLDGPGVVPGSASLVEARGSVLSSATQGLNSSKFDSIVYVAPQPGGDASGSDEADPMAYADAYRLWLSVQPRVLTVRLAGGTYQVAAGDGEYRGASATRSVSFVSTAGATLVGDVRFAFGGPFSSAGVAFGAGTTLLVDRGADAQVASGSIAQLQVDGGAIDLDPQVVVDSIALRGGATRLVQTGARLVPAPVGGGVVPPSPSPADGAIPIAAVGSLTAVSGSLVVDGVALAVTGSAAGVPILSPGARVEILDGGSVAGATSVDSSPGSSCSSPDAFGRTTCSVACDVVHPFVKQSACQADGGVLLSQGRARDPASGVESSSCSWRPDLPSAQRGVLVPGSDGTAANPQVSTALDLVAAPGYAPSAGGYCSMNP